MSDDHPSNDSIAMQVATQYFALSNARDVAGIRRLLTASSTYSSANTGIFLGQDDIVRMQSEFFASFDTLQWQVHEAVEVKPGIVRFDFTLAGVKTDGEQLVREGYEYVVVHENHVQHVQVHNK